VDGGSAIGRVRAFDHKKSHRGRNSRVVAAHAGFCRKECRVCASPDGGEPTRRSEELVALHFSLERMLPDSHAGVSGMFERHVTASTLRKLSLHRLRHTRATIALRAVFIRRS